MGEEDVTNESNTNEETNDAQAQETIEDVDADTKDVEKTETQDFTSLLQRLSTIEDVLGRLSGSIEALRSAQGILVENGATVQDFEDENIDLNDDGFVSPNELDLLI